MNFRIVLTIILGSIFYTAYAEHNNKGIVDFSKLENKGVKIFHNYDGVPDDHGLLSTQKCIFPDFEKGVYYRCGWWPTGANRVYGNVFNPEEIASLNEGGLFLLLKVNPEKYLAILPLASSRGYSWFDTDSTNIILKFGHHGKKEVKGDIPVYAWAYGQSPYEACNMVWDEALSNDYLPGVTKLREKKPYPEMFNYLGWCSWEQYHANITQENMTKAVNSIEESDVAIRYVLIDDGFFDRQSLQPNSDFPEGLGAITKFKKKDKIRWMGLWYAFLGENHGIKEPGNIGKLSKQMYTSAGGKLMPNPEDRNAADNFYNYILSIPKESGFDFVKVDFQTDALTFYAGSKHNAALDGLPVSNADAVDNPVNSAIILTKSLQENAERMGFDMMNCNWHSTINMLYSENSVVGRCSEDYKVGKLEIGKKHLYHSYAAMPWLGQIAWGDHDMFHSNDPYAGRMMAVSKAISGGPVYLSDEPSEFLKENIEPLCYQDGLLLRPLAPAAPLPDDLFKSFGDKKLYKVVAPLKNKSAAIVVYNFGDKDTKLNDQLTFDDYANASGMIQPYPGKWNIPNEGLFVYNWYSCSGKLMKENIDVSIKGFNDKLFIVVPVIDGWGIVGRTDKYLSTCAVENIQYDKDEVSFVLKEGGSFSFFLAEGKPFAENVSFVEKEKGLWSAEIKKGKKNSLIRIKRIN